MILSLTELNYTLALSFCNAFFKACWLIPDGVVHGGVVNLVPNDQIYVLDKSRLESARMKRLLFSCGFVLWPGKAVNVSLTLQVVRNTLVIPNLLRCFEVLQ